MIWYLGEMVETVGAAVGPGEPGPGDNAAGPGGGEQTASDQSIGNLEAGEDVPSTDEAGNEYVIGEDGETVYVLSTEPGTEYLVATPVDADAAQDGDSTANSGVISKTYTTAANVISKTAETAKPAIKSMAFSVLNAVIIMLIGVQVAKLVRKLLSRTLKSIHMDNSVRAFLSSSAYVVTCGITAFIALEKLGVSSGSVVALLGSIGLAVSLSLQDFLGNFAGGVIIMVLKPFRAGDYIVSGANEGTVSATSLFYTTLNTVDNRQVILPNGSLSNANIINVTAEERRRLEIKVTISYESDLRLAKEILQGLFDKHPNIMHEEDIVVFVSELGEDGVVLVARGWILQADYWPAKWAITEDLKLAYDEAGIEIPYKQLDVHVKDNIVKQ